MQFNLFYQKYTDKDPRRNAELQYCLEMNKKLHFLNVIELDGYKRWTYNELFELTQKYKEAINIIANSDIILTDSIIQCQSMLDTECYALCRWDIVSLNPYNAKFYNHTDSQDTWIFKGSVNKMEGADFTLGRAGCDNRIAKIISDNGYNVRNLGRTIETYHYHLSGTRNYDPLDVVQGEYKLLRIE